MIKFYDNKGETADRYGMAVLEANGWDIYAFDNQPNMPDGINMFGGTITNDPGDEDQVRFSDIPENVQTAMLNRLMPVPF
tara:strand:+ start:440 stop:679 length:240 start_codon:yes stop_codon:yes gene_type:complete